MNLPDSSIDTDLDSTTLVTASTRQLAAIKHQITALAHQFGHDWDGNFLLRTHEEDATDIWRPWMASEEPCPELLLLRFYSRQNDGDHNSYRIFASARQPMVPQMRRIGIRLSAAASGMVQSYPVSEYDGAY